MKTAPRPALTAVNLDDRNGGVGQDDLLTVDEAARFLHVPLSWVYEHARTGSGDRLPVIKVGKYLRFDRRESPRIHRREARGLPPPAPPGGDPALPLALRSGRPEGKASRLKRRLAGGAQCSRVSDAFRRRRPSPSPLSCDRRPTGRRARR